MMYNDIKDLKTDIIKKDEEVKASNHISKKSNWNFYFKIFVWITLF